MPRTSRSRRLASCSTATGRNAPSSTTPSRPARHRLGSFCATPGLLLGAGLPGLIACSLWMTVPHGCAYSLHRWRNAELRVMTDGAASGFLAASALSACAGDPAQPWFLRLDNDERQRRRRRFGFLQRGAPTPVSAHTGQGAPTDEAHQDAGDGSPTGLKPAGLMADELMEQANGNKPSDNGTG